MYFKSCPFCGREAHLDFAHGSNQIYADKNGSIASTLMLYIVFCENCGVRTPPCETIEIAELIWNRRVEDSE